MDGNPSEEEVGIDDARNVLLRAAVNKITFKCSNGGISDGGSFVPFLPDRLKYPGYSDLIVCHVESDLPPDLEAAFVLF